MNDSHHSLATLLAPAVEALGYELWGIVLIPRARHPLVRVYIEKPEGVQVEDCARASHQISGVLAVEDPITGNYTLEVSSPGLDRPLFTVAHFKRFVGAIVKCKTRMPVEKRRHFQGVIEQVQDDTIQLRCGSVLIILSMDNIERANIVPDFSSIKG